MEEWVFTDGTGGLHRRPMPAHLRRRPAAYQAAVPIFDPYAPGPGPFAGPGGAVAPGQREPWGDAPTPAARSFTYQATGFDDAWGQPPNLFALAWSPIRRLYEPVRNFGRDVGQRASQDQLHAEYARLAREGVFVQAYQDEAAPGTWRFRWVRVRTPWPSLEQPYQVLGEYGERFLPAAQRAIEAVRQLQFEAEAARQAERMEIREREEERAAIRNSPLDQVLMSGPAHAYRAPPKPGALSDYAWIPQRALPKGCPYPYPYMPVPQKDYATGAWLSPDYTPSIPLPPPYDEIFWRCAVPDDPRDVRGKGSPGPEPRRTPTEPKGKPPSVPPAREPQDAWPPKAPPQAPPVKPPPVVTPRGDQPAGDVPPAQPEPPPAPPEEPPEGAPGTFRGPVMEQLLREQDEAKKAAALEAQEEQHEGLGGSESEALDLDPDVEAEVDTDPRVRRAREDLDRRLAKVVELHDKVHRSKGWDRTRAEKALAQARQDYQRAKANLATLRRNTADRVAQNREQHLRFLRKQLESKKANTSNPQKRSALDAEIGRVSEGIARAQLQRLRLAEGDVPGGLGAQMLGSIAPGWGGDHDPALDHDPGVRRALENLRQAHVAWARAHADMLAAPAGSRERARREAAAQALAQRVGELTEGLQLARATAAPAVARALHQSVARELDSLRRERSKLLYTHATTWNAERRAALLDSIHRVDRGIHQLQQILSQRPRSLGAGAKADSLAFPGAQKGLPAKDADPLDGSGGGRGGLPLDPEQFPDLVAPVGHGGSASASDAQVEAIKEWLGEGPRLPSTDLDQAERDRLLADIRAQIAALEVVAREKRIGSRAAADMISNRMLKLKEIMGLLDPASVHTVARLRAAQPVDQGPPPGDDAPEGPIQGLRNDPTERQGSGAGEVIYPCVGDGKEFVVAEKPKVGNGGFFFKTDSNGFLQVVVWHAGGNAYTLSGDPENLKEFMKRYDSAIPDPDGAKHISMLGLRVRCTRSGLSEAAILSRGVGALVDILGLKEVRNVLRNATELWSDSAIMDVVAVYAAGGEPTKEMVSAAIEEAAVEVAVGAFTAGLGRAAGAVKRALSAGERANAVDAVRKALHRADPSLTQTQLKRQAEGIVSRAEAKAVRLVGQPVRGSYSSMARQEAAAIRKEAKRAQREAQHRFEEAKRKLDELSREGPVAGLGPTSSAEPKVPPRGTSTPDAPAGGGGPGGGRESAGSPPLGLTRFGSRTRVPAEKANRRWTDLGLEAPHSDPCFEIQLAEAEGGWVRLFSGKTDPRGDWYLRADDLARMTPEQVMTRWGLPTPPDQVVPVVFSRGARFYESPAARTSFGAGGGLQREFIGGEVTLGRARPWP